MKGIILFLSTIWIFYLFTLQGLSFLLYNEKLRNQMYDLFNSDFGKELPFHRYYEGKLWSVGYVNITGIIGLIWGILIPVLLLLSLSIRGVYLLLIPILGNFLFFHGINHNILALRSRFIKDGNIGRGGLKNCILLLPSAHLSVVPKKALKIIYISIVLMHFYTALRIII